MQDKTNDFKIADNFHLLTFIMIRSHSLFVP